MNKYDDRDVDEGIKEAVEILREHGIETYESCQGYGTSQTGISESCDEQGKQHVHEYPFILFHGDKSEGYKAVGIAIQNGLRVASLNRVWDVIDGELDGPTWELRFVGLPVRQGC